MKWRSHTIKSVVEWWIGGMTWRINWSKMNLEDIKPTWYA